MKTKIKKLPTLAQLRRKADRLYQIYCLTKNSNSLLSGIQAEVVHHFIHKATSNRLRYDPENGITLTNREHCRIHTQNDPADILAIVANKGKKWQEYIAKARQELVKPNRDFYLTAIKNLSLC